MKKVKLSNLILILSITVVGVILLWVIIKEGDVLNLANKKNDNTALVNKTTNQTSIPDSYIAYALSNKTKEQTNVYSYNINTGKKDIIYSFQLSPKQNTPYFKKYTDDSILIYRAGEEDKIALIDTKGNVIDDFVNPGYSDFLVSPDTKKIAYSESKKDIKKDTYNSFFTIQNIVSGKKNSMKEEISLYVGNNYISGELRPRKWTSDSEFVYVDYVVPTSGYFIGLTKINSESLEKERLKIIDDLKLVNLIFDDQMNIYGYEEYDIFSSDDLLPTTIYQVSIADQSVQRYELKDTRIRTLWGVDSSGRFISYDYSTGEHGPNLWVYDKENQTETQVNISGGVSHESYWCGNNLLFKEEEITEKPEIKFSIVSYNTLTNQTTVIDSYQTSLGDDSFEIIECFN